MTLLLATVLMLCSPIALSSKATQIIVSNQQSDKLSILSLDGKEIRTVDTCERPQKMRFTKDRSAFLIACTDESLIAIYDAASVFLLGRILLIQNPASFDLHPNGRHLYVSNENNTGVSLYDVTNGQHLASYKTGPEPQDILCSRDGRYVFVASKASNMVQVIDVQANKITNNISVGKSPSQLALSHDGRELWVTEELAGTVGVIDISSMKKSDSVTFAPDNITKKDITTNGILFNKDGKTSYITLSRSNLVAEVDVRRRQAIRYLPVGNQPGQLALDDSQTTLYVSNEGADSISIIDLSRFSVISTERVGRGPYDILINDN